MTLIKLTAIGRTGVLMAHVQRRVGMVLTYGRGPAQVQSPNILEKTVQEVLSRLLPAMKELARSMEDGALGTLGRPVLRLAVLGPGKENGSVKTPVPAQMGHHALLLTVLKKSTAT